MIVVTRLLSNLITLLIEKSIAIILWCIFGILSSIWLLNIIIHTLYVFHKMRPDKEGLENRLVMFSNILSSDNKIYSFCVFPHESEV